MTSSFEHWYIDSWDASAGRAFCSRRPAMDAIDDLNVEAYFIAPPFFVPELVASRAPGLAAARGMFQLGLFIDQREIAFDSLEEIIALVRRVYSSRGMWPGPGGSLPPAPPPPDSPPALGDSPLRSPPMPSLPGFAEHLKLFIRDDATITASLFMEWPPLDQMSSAETRQLLVAAGAAIMDELLRRAPRASRPEDLQLWQTLFVDFNRLCQRLDIDGDVCDLRHVSSVLQKHFKDAMDLGRIRTGHGHSISGLYELFERLPLPKDIAQDYVIAKGHDPSLLTLVSAYFSHAGAVNKRNVQLEFALLMFAGSCVTTQNRLGSYDVSSQSTVSAAFAWCKSQLPTVKYSPAIEKMIRATPADWYRFEMSSPKPSNGPGSGPMPGSRPKPRPRPGPGGNQEKPRASPNTIYRAQQSAKNEAQSPEKNGDQDPPQFKF